MNTDIKSEDSGPDAGKTLMESEDLHRDTIDRKRSEEERGASLEYLQQIERVDQAIRKETDVEQMLWKAVNVVLSVFGCDRVWLLYPCDPEASYWRVPVEVTRPEYPGALALDETVPMTTDVAETFRALLETNEPVYGVLAPGEPLWDEDDQYGVRAFLSMALRPRTGKAWDFGLHQCTYAREWTQEELKLFKAIGRRIEDALSSTLFLRNLRESESLLKTTQELAKVGGWVWDVDSRTGQWTDEVYRIHELPVDHTIDHMARSLECYHPQDRPLIEKAFRRAVEEGESYDLELRFTTAKGNPRWVRTMASPITIGGRVVRVTGNLMDITAHRKADEQRRTHLHFLESLERIDQAIRQEMDVERMLWDVVQTVFKIFNGDRVWLLHPCDPDAPSFRVPVEVSRPEYPGAKALNLEVPMAPGQVQDMQEALEAEDPVMYTAGTDRPVSQETSRQFHVQAQMFMAIYPKVGRPWLFGMHQCSHPRVWTPDEQKLFKEIGRRIADGLSSVLFLQDVQKSEERFRSTFEQAAVGMAHISPGGRWLRVNRRLCDMVGYTREEFLEKTFQDITHPDDLETDQDNARRLLAGEISTYNREKRYLHKDGSIVWIDLTVSLVRQSSGDPAYLIAVIEDISGRKQAEKEKQELQGQLLQVQKLESIGRLAGGVAHDFNNMISVIIGNAELALKKTVSAPPLQTHLEQILSAAKRSADITRQLLAFARKQTIAPELIDLNEAIKAILKMIRRLIGENIELAWIPKQGLRPVVMDASQIDQILANLCVNARDAIVDVGKITIETRNVDIDEAYCAEHAGFEPGPFVQLVVSDDGCGMEKEACDRVFEPFFTTKGVGKGTGLGLATVYGIVKQNKGLINVYSEPGVGTTFRLYLPCSTDEAHIPPSGKFREETMGGSETILLVEDESTLLELCLDMLESLGYRVLAANTPCAAIELAEKHGGDIDLLLTDMIMPEMNGLELARRLQQRYPKLRQLFMSGYTANGISHHGGILKKSMVFLQKPLTIKDLSRKIREALNK